MKLEKLFELQETFQKSMNQKYDIQYIKDMTLALQVELSEAIQETAWKPWKKNAKYNKEKFQKELIDCWHFLINLSIASGMNAEGVYNKFVIKHKINRRRQKNDY